MSESFDLPLAPIQRLIKQALPPSATVSKEVKSSLGKAAALFVLYLTHTSNEMCRSAKRSMVNSDDVLAAVEEMEFDMFLEPLQEYLKAYREETQSKKKAKAPSGEGGAAATEGSGKKRGRKSATTTTSATSGAAPSTAATDEPDAKKQKVAIETPATATTTSTTESHPEEHGEDEGDMEEEDD